MAFLGSQHEAAEGHNSRAIQIKAGDGCAPRGGEADQLGEVLVPSKVLTPVVAARVVERHDNTRFRVGALREGALGAITAKARQRQVLQRVCATKSQRLDVVNGERAGGTRGRSEAVLAAAVRTPEDLLTASLGQVTAHVSDNPSRTYTKLVHEGTVVHPAQLG